MAKAVTTNQSRAKTKASAIRSNRTHANTSKHRSEWTRFTVWDEWTKLTRFAALIDWVLENTATVWKSLPIKGLSEATLNLPSGTKSLQCSAQLFLPLVEDRHTISSVILLSSYALIEGHAEDVLKKLVASPIQNVSLIDAIRSGKATPESIMSAGGIEGWVTCLLIAVNRTWDNIDDGKAGITEVGVVRNALAHGVTHVTEEMIRRVQNSGAALPWKLGEKIYVSMDLMRTYRGRLRSLARTLADGAIVSIRASNT